MIESLAIEEMLSSDWEAVCSIYEEGIRTGNATFQQAASSWEEWDRSHIEKLRFVARLDGRTVGWIALTPISSRCVYQGVAEVSVYISNDAKGKGIGGKLLEIIIGMSEEKGYWTLQSGIFPENVQSVHLHKKYGFMKVGRRVKIGKLNGVWRDVLLLERRSNKVGFD